MPEVVTRVTLDVSHPIYSGSQTKTSLKMHKAAENKKANANKHHDEAIHLPNKKFIKSRDES